MTVQIDNPENYRWSNETNSPLSNLSRQAAIADIQLAKACTPNSDDDVENHASRICIRIGCGKSRAMMMCDIGLFLRKMPRISQLVLERGCFSLAHVYAMAMAVIAVDGAKCVPVETDILSYLHPQRDNQALPGMRTFKRTLCEIVHKHDPLGVNDEEKPKDYKASEYVAFEQSMDGNFGDISARLRKDRASEFMSILTSVRLTETKAGRKCTWGDALMHLARGTATTKVVMNVYSALPGGAHPQPSASCTSHTNSSHPHSAHANSAHADSPHSCPTVWLEGAGWLDNVAAKEWLNRLTDIRLSADSTVEGYTPSESQIARIRGRDGTCRFPGCDVPATHCDADHIKPFDHENPQTGGPTSTANMHCLCRQHHNLKTHRYWEITAHADGTETWSSCDGTITARSLPTGPLAGFGRQTFNQRLTRKAQTIRELNATNERLNSEATELLNTARMNPPEINFENIQPTERYLEALSEFHEDQSEFERAATDGWKPEYMKEPEPPF